MHTVSLGWMQFVKKYREWTEDDWANVAFSDESKINRICSQMELGGSGMTSQPSSIVKQSREQSSLVAGVLWYGLACHGMDLVILPKSDDTMDSHLYIQILKEDLQLSVEEWGISQEEFIFQHDNDPKHTAKVTKAYLEEVQLTEEAGRLLYWPAQSPDPQSH